MEITLRYYGREIQGILQVCSCICSKPFKSRTEYYSWDKFLEVFQNLNPEDLSWGPPVDFDDRFYYYPAYVLLTMDLSSFPLQTTTEEADIAKCSAYMLSDFPNMECRLLAEDAELGNRGRKRTSTEDEGSQQKTSKRGSSIPPGSDTAKAKLKEKG